jgi:two-component system cell cycle sensor histidine kinase/response regulator CckA
MIQEPKGNILIVDDDANNRFIYERLFTNAEYAVTTAENKTQTFDQIENFKPDLILLDIVLGTENGIDILKELRDQFDLTFVYIVMITGKMKSSQDQAIGLELGADGYITRPIGNRELLARIESFMRHKRTVEALRKSEARFRKIIEKNPDAMLIVDKDGNIRFANPASEQLFMLTADELLNMSFGYPIIKDEHSEIQIVGSRDKEKIGEMRTIDIEWEEKDSFLTSIRDITERKILEEQLRQAQKIEAIGQLAGGVAHDFNNMLGGINLFAEILKAKYHNQNDIVSYANKILGACDRASNLTGQLLRFARKAKLNVSQCDVHESITHIVEILSSTIDRMVKIETYLNAKPSIVQADPALIENAILNLCVNARDAMPEGGTLSISTETVYLNEQFEEVETAVSNKYIAVNIRDTGIGMHKKVLDRIFEPFFTTKDVGQGTGLGLASVHGTIKQHEGHIKVQSEPGVGSEFIFYLPLTTDGSEDEDIAYNQHITKGNGELILFVDDETFLHEPVEELLITANYQVNCVSDGAEAVDYFKTHSDTVDLVILDMIMPHMNGLQCLRELKKIQPEIKVIMASGYAEKSLRESAIKEGAVAFVSKPYSFIELTKLIKQSLHQTP